MLKTPIIEKIFLRPLSQLWETAYRTRRSLYEYGFIKKNYFKVPIISIGNLTFGGTGKTPVIIWLCKYFEKKGQVPLVLTRGYKGELEGQDGIIRGGQRFLSNPKKYGDEPLLIGRKMKLGAVVVGKNRSENLRKYFHKVSPDVVLLDDGFQHIQLYRSFNIVLFNALLPLEKYKTAPQGYLREGLTALKDADAIMITRIDQVSEQQLNQLLKLLSQYHRSEIPIVQVGYLATGVYNCYDQKAFDMEALAGKKIVAVTAIASPDSFYYLLESFGGEIVEKISYPDHYFFEHTDINEILFKANQLGAIIVTSEKDIVKIRRVTQDNKIFYVHIDIKFISGEEALIEQIDKVVKVK